MHAQGDFNESYGYGYACKPASWLVSSYGLTPPIGEPQQIKMA